MIHFFEFSGSIIVDDNGCKITFHTLFTYVGAQSLLEDLVNSLPWEPVGKREVCWFSNMAYTYGSVSHRTNPTWPQTLEAICSYLCTLLDTHFNSLLCTLYRNGNNILPWHSDNEIELGKTPTIASISLGQARLFSLRKRKDHSDQAHVTLVSGSLLVMSGQTQQLWQHQIGKDQYARDLRINLTFRKINLM